MPLCRVICLPSYEAFWNINWWVLALFSNIRSGRKCLSSEERPSLFCSWLWLLIKVLYHRPHRCSFELLLQKKVILANSAKNGFLSFGREAIHRETFNTFRQAASMIEQHLLSRRFYDKTLRITTLLITWINDTSHMFFLL